MTLSIQNLIYSMYADINIRKSVYHYSAIGNLLWIKASETTQSVTSSPQRRDMENT